MENKFVCYGVGVLVFGLVSCSHAPPSPTPVGNQTAKSVEEKPVIPVVDFSTVDPKTLSGQSFELKLVPDGGRVEVASLCNVSVIKAKESGELVHKKIEAVDFKLKTVTLPQSKPDRIMQTQEVTFKDGFADLHDLAFPEKDEKIEFTYTPDAHVTHVSGYPEKSIFYVQAIPLPPGPVKIGQEWVVDSQWMTGPGGVELTSKVKGKFVDWKPCGAHRCAEISVTGIVHMPEAMEKQNGFTHKVTGLFLFEPVRGLIPYSEFVTDEQLRGVGAQADVRSTLRSVLTQPPGYHTISREELVCPSEKMEE